MTCTTAITTTTTTSTTEWPQVESSMEDIAPPSSDDLFDGDILGDELMDIYNAAVGSGGNDDEDMNEIPSLLQPAEITDVEEKDGTIDDGFGAFRPSTSFNDLYNSVSTTPAVNLSTDSSPNNNSTIKATVNGSDTGTTATTTTNTSYVLTPVVSSTSLSPQLVITPQIIPSSSATTTTITTTNGVVASSPVVGTKRKIEANATIGAPAPKRRVSTGRNSLGASSKATLSKTTSPCNKKTNKKKNGTNNTPNPLSSLSSTTIISEIGTTVAPLFVPAVKASNPSIITNKTTKTSLVSIKIEPINQVKPNIEVSSPSVTIVKPRIPTIPVATATTIPRTTTIPATLSTTSTGTTIKATAAFKAKTRLSTSSTAPVPVLSNPPTEADFKSVAQAAVNNLIMNVGSNNNNKTDDKTDDEKSKKESLSSKSSSTSLSSATATAASTITIVKRVDTSTEHVKALTGSNWVAVCGGGNNSSNNAGGTGGDNSNNNNSTNSQNSNDKNCNRARRSNLTPDERARQNRDRNREHARNTRLRKKAYVEELKATLSALVTQRDAADLEKRHTSQRELEQREVRFRVLEEFLKLRGRNEANPARWAAILEDKFDLTLPVTCFRDMVHSNCQDSNKSYEQVLTGVTEVMKDSTLCSTFLQGLIGKSTTSEIITLTYNCDRNDFFMDSCTAMLDWTATSAQGLSSESGSRNEVILKGQIRAKFSLASNKLISAVMRFDTSAIISQVNGIAKLKESSLVDAAEVAAQVAANEADALLDSLQMPHFELPNIPLKINYVAPSSVSSANSEDNSDDDKDEIEEDNLIF